MPEIKIIIKISLDFLNVKKRNLTGILVPVVIAFCSEMRWFQYKDFYLHDIEQTFLPETILLFEEIMFRICTGNITSYHLKTYQFVPLILTENLWSAKSFSDIISQHWLQ